MAKLALTDIAAGYLSIATYNANNTLLETALENTLSRDGTAPNTMSASLDLNSNKATNLADGTNDQDAVTVAQLNAASVVATTTAASAVTVADAGGYYVATTAEAALQELWVTLASTGNGEGASLIGIEDSGTNFTATNVEAALAELAASAGDGENLTIQGNDPIFNIIEDDGGADETHWQFYASGGALFLVARDDADTTNTGIFRVDRTGTTVDNILMFTEINMADLQIVKPVLKDYGITNTVKTVAGNAVAIALTDGNSFEVDLEAATGTVTITLSSAPASGTYGEVILKVKQDSTSDRTITWAAAGGSFVWPAGSAPTMSTGSDAIDIYTFKTWDAGTIWYGNASQDYS